VTAGTPVPDKLIGLPQLATLQIRKVIFHDGPRKVKGKDQAPTLSEVECTIDLEKIGLLKDKLVRVFGVQRSLRFCQLGQPTDRLIA
jgi:hypothetical protein